MSRRGKRGYKSVIVQSLIAMPCITILLAFVCAKLITSEMIKEDHLNLCVYAIAGLTSFAVGLYCAIRMPQRKALWGMMASGAYAVMLLLGNLLFFGLGYSEVIPTLLCILCMGIVGSLTGAVKRRKYA